MGFTFYNFTLLFFSAMNSCPASPRSGTPQYLNQNNTVTENLSAAAAVSCILK